MTFPLDDTASPSGSLASPDPLQVDAMVNEGGPPPVSQRDAREASTEGSNWIRRQAERRLQSLAQRYLATLFGSRARLSESMNAVPERMQAVARQTRLMLEAVDDFNRGEYRNIPWLSLAAMSGALLYAVNPADVVPDVLPSLGTIDDAIVVAIAVRLVRGDLRRYCEHKGYAVEDYF